jgi:hypothetical protein
VRAGRVQAAAERPYIRSATAAAAVPFLVRFRPEKIASVRAISPIGGVSSLVIIIICVSSPCDLIRFKCGPYTPPSGCDIKINYRNDKLSTTTMTSR